MARTLYRIVATNPPTRRDFQSAASRGQIPLSQDPEELRLAHGISTFATLTQARNKAQRYPWLGAYIAELTIPEAPEITIERTLPGTRGHHTVWGDPEQLLRCVVRVVPVVDAGPRGSIEGHSGE
jgi:hypothetical protein